MKKIFTYSITVILIAFLFTSCAKERVVVYDDSPGWLSQERGDVVYSNNFCGYYVVETNYGYTVIENLDGLRTYEGDAMYGDFGGYGTRGFYNYTADVVTRGTVIEYDLSYDEAMNALDYYCPLGKVNGLKIKESSKSKSKVARPSTPLKQ